MRYRFGPHELNLTDQQLLKDGVLQSIEPQVFDVLRHLIENAGRLVTQDDLIDSVWNGRIVSDSAISARISAARAAIGDSGRAQKFIKTVPKRGFQFIGEVERVDPEPSYVDVSQPVKGFGSRPAIAVLPFDNMSGEAEQDFFVDGLTDVLPPYNSTGFDVIP